MLRLPIKSCSSFRGRAIIAAARLHRARGRLADHTWGPLTKRIIKHGKGPVILVNDERSTTPSNKMRAPKKEDGQHPDFP
jgi:hypothetical protein